MRLKEIIKKICDEINVILLAAVKRLKGVTSRYLRQEFPELLKLPSFWTNSYFVGTFGDV
ncbi:MAG: transposase [Desulfobacterales bacterium]|nr:transposase [Desulfobacterales bacterium]